MPVQFSKDQADTRLYRPEQLTAEEARAVYPFLNALHHHLPRIQMDLALQQIEAIERFNEASGKLTKAAIFVGCAQVMVAVIALAISLMRH